MVFRSNMQYTSCSYTGERCFCCKGHGTNVELKKKKEKLIGIRVYKYYFAYFILHTILGCCLLNKIQFLNDIFQFNFLRNVKHNFNDKCFKLKVVAGV